MTVRELAESPCEERKLTISLLCELLSVSRKGFYKQSFDDPDASLKASSTLLYCQYLRSQMPQLGVEKMQYLCNEYFKGAFHIGRDWLYALLGANGMLHRKSSRKGPPRTTNGIVNHGYKDHLNTLPKYIPPGHCRLVVSDITYIKCGEGFIYLSMTMDGYSRIITGFDLRRDLSAAGPLNAMRQTISFYKKHKFSLDGLIAHSDRGSQYLSKEMIQLEENNGIIISVTQTGDPLHNAMAERLNGTIKHEWLHEYATLSFEETYEKLSKNITLYNTARPHQSLGLKTPMQTLIPNYPNPLTSNRDYAY